MGEGRAKEHIHVAYDIIIIVVIIPALPSFFCPLFQGRMEEEELLSILKALSNHECWFVSLWSVVRKRAYRYFSFRIVEVVYYWSLRVTLCSVSRRGACVWCVGVGV